MLYSQMIVGRHGYLHLHAEQMIENAQQGRKFMLEEGPLTRKGMDALKEFAGEEYTQEFLMIEFTGITEIPAEFWTDLIAAVKKLFLGGSEIYLVNIPNQEIRTMIQLLHQGGLREFNEQHGDGTWCVTVTKDRKPMSLLAAFCRALAESMSVENAKILMEDKPEGKTYNVKRLLADGEGCMHYFFYRLALMMCESGLVSRDPKKNKNICLIPDNESAWYMAVELCKFLGCEMRTVDELRGRIEPGRKYIQVRDVIHIFCEVRRLETFLMTGGAQLAGSVCITEINTGVGERNQRVSFYQVELDKGMEHYIKQQKRHRMAELLEEDEDNFT